MTEHPFLGPVTLAPTIAPASEASEWSDWLRNEMAEQGLSQRLLAELAGVDHSTISRLLAGPKDPRLSVLVAVSRALGADLLDLR